MRFAGTVEPFARVEVHRYVEWLLTIQEVDWPKMADAAWHDWGARFAPLVSELMYHYPCCSVAGVGMFILEPGRVHPTHKDVQPPEWLARIHVPLVTNPGAVFVMDDGEHHLEVGTAYRMNTLANHAVENRGSTTRVHFIFDLKRGSDAK
ncbi:MAG: aspartyl/asparaginyl beta-hydroxylase domain-containing protein [Nitrososphaera sp.]|nr:aspartyl/asparaginyl beta-hydroxylase domain-containing protein [Nitrososphaera sp.]